MNTLTDSMIWTMMFAIWIKDHPDRLSDTEEMWVKL
jgi:hypothetical protein